MLDWMKVGKDTIKKPEIQLLAKHLKTTRHAAFGLWFDLYAWADDHVSDGFLPNMTLEDIAELSGVPTEVCLSLASPEIGWLIQHYATEGGRPGGVMFSNWNRHNGKCAKKRAETARRMAKSRAGNRKP